MPVDSPKAEHLIPTGSHETQDCPCPTLQYPSLTVRRRLLDDFMVDWEIIPDRTARVMRHYIANLPVTIGDIGNRRHRVLDDTPGRTTVAIARNPARRVPLMAL